MFLQASLYIAECSCARPLFAMLLAIRARFEAPHGFAALTLVFFCQIPPWTIPPGLHQVRTGTCARLPTAWRAMH
jgi:hypothetical protein